jgi:hypothetical protein
MLLALVPAEHLFDERFESGFAAAVTAAALDGGLGLVVRRRATTIAAAPRELAIRRRRLLQFLIHLALVPEWGHPRNER